MTDNKGGQKRPRAFWRTTRREVVVGFASAPVALTAHSLPAAGQPATPRAAPNVAPLNVTINDKDITMSIDARTTLLDLLREGLDLTGTKKGCDQGQCGACTVLLNGRRVNSCLTLAAMCDGAKITTIEGLGSPGKLHPMQQAFIDRDAFQCGYCTPGQICSAVGLISEGKARTADEIRESMSGNLCRCGAYTNIVAAIQDVMGRS